MIKLNELIENGFGVSLDINLGVTDSTIYKIANQSICFDIGELFASSEKIKPIRELIKLPFNSCFFQMYISGEIRKETIGVIVAQAANETIDFFVFIRPNGFWLAEAAGTIDISNNDFSISYSGPDIYSLIIYEVTKYISAMNCSNIIKVEHKPDERIQKKRAKKGKPPLFSYWTLELSLPSERTEGPHHGGTHASPRLHLRRGHARQYAPGKYTWVQPCTVGNKKLGMVHKDYAVTIAQGEIPAKGLSIPEAEIPY